MVQKSINTYVVLVALMAVFAMLVFAMKGERVSSKFNRANSEVTNSVTFGGGGSYVPATPSRRRQIERRQVARPEAIKRPTYRPAPIHAPVPEPVVEVNAPTQPELDRFSTFALDVDTGSYTLARAMLRRGNMPRTNTVRVEEFVNYFGYDYPQPETGPFAVHIEAAPSPFLAQDNKYLVRIGVQSRDLKKSDRRPNHLTFLIDVSGSMAQPNKLPMAKSALRKLTKNLGPKDTVAIVTYAAQAKVVLRHTRAKNKRKILRAIDQLKAGGGTYMGDGMRLAYETAAAKLNSDHNNRVIVLSDGDANIGSGTHQDILESIEYYVAEGINMSTIGLGMGNYRDQMMEQLANKGHGNYYYIDTHDEAQKVFGEQIDGTLHVVAKDVKVQVEFDPAKVANYRLVGYENRAVADHEFRNDEVDGGDIGAGHTVTALYEIELLGEPSDTIASVYVRSKKPSDHTSDEQSFQLTALDFRGSLQDASPDFMFAAAVAGFAEILRESPHAKGLSFALIHEIAAGAAGEDDERKRFLELVRLTISLHG